MESLWNLMWGVVIGNNTSSSGWEYLAIKRGLGFESCGCHLCVNLIVLLF